MNVEKVKLLSASVSLWQMPSNQLPCVRVPKQRNPLRSSKATIFTRNTAARQAVLQTSDRH